MVYDYNIALNPFESFAVWEWIGASELMFFVQFLAINVPNP